MGANATTKVPSYAAGQVLTAADLSITNSGIPVFANSTDRTNSFGGTGEKTLAEGQFAYLEDDNKTYYYDGAAWQEVGGAGLKFITGATFTTVTSVSLPQGTFSSTYRNYRVIYQLTAVTSDCDLTMRLRASGSDITTANYETTMWGYSAAGVASNQFSSGQTSWNVGEQDAAVTYNYWIFDVISPQVADETHLVGTYAWVNKAANAKVVRTGDNSFIATTQADSLSFISSVASSITGYYRVYGYADS